MKYRIENINSGLDMGVWEGATPEEAVEAMHIDAGYRSTEDCEMQTGQSTWDAGVRACEATEDEESPITPTDLLSLADIAELTGRPLVTVRTWTHRYHDFPAPWRTGRSGEPNLYLRSDIESWLQRTGRLK